MKQEIKNRYGDRVRVRACGLCWKDDSLLLINHKHLGPNNFWSPPGGGIELFETAEHCLTREFLEETGLGIKVNKFLFASEYIQNPLHAIELFFDVSILNGTLSLGHDPETSLKVINELSFKSFYNIQSLPIEERHSIFSHCQHPADLRNLCGYIRML